ncbi:hypothetical protein MMIC_P0389 [Mariprofundus micogutta]|uniref:SPOR domain-containing protein n=1 Tax=Mariprofundus micogutta TaxID=1921010 RepID=A0A1L8CKP2_9PROT|nr:SPOR domain-containing protein [Mariprofundus micogutta]GAV19455.1 hypothetical protein MMIC_P0389 [Mariprofundus micogutta]
MSELFSDIRRTDTGLDQTDPEEDRKGDFILLVGILVLLAGVAGYLVLNPAESTLKKGVAVKKTPTITTPATVAPVELVPVNPAQFAAEPVASEPVASEPVASEPVAAEPVAAEPVAAEPVAAEPVAAEPVAAEPVAAEPVAAEPVAAEPVAAEPVAAEPVAAEPVAAEPVASEPVASEPVAAVANSAKVLKPAFAWAVNLVSVTSQPAALKISEKLKADGTETEVVEIQVKGRKYYRIRVPNLASKQAAAAFKEKSAYKDAWINRYTK